MNKKGAMVLRDFIFMIIIFSGVLALSSIIVINMAQEYSNSNMEFTYNDLGTSGLGNIIAKNISESVATMRNSTDESAGSIGSITGFIKGAGTILLLVLGAPIIVGNALEIMMASIGVPTLISVVVGNIIMLLIYAMVIFVIVSALLRGGKV